jgi:hypothetical protein
MSGLTVAQHRILTEVRATGSRVYNGRARRSIQALEDAGLVTATYDMIPQWKGGGMELVDRITVTPKEVDQ